MLQMTSAALAAQTVLASAHAFPPAWTRTEELQRATDAWLQRWLEERSRIVQANGPLARLADAVDRMARTDRPEHTDNPAVSPERKLKIVRSLHRTNRLQGVYRHYIRILTPLIRDIAAARGRPVRLLELASGHGEMAMNLAGLARRKNLPVQVTGSDYVEDLVRDAAARARARGCDARFRTLNAFDMGTLEPGAYDIVLVTGTMHHFSPGQLAVMMAQSRLAGCSAFVGLDGHRSLALLLWLPAFHLLTLLPDHIHDAWMTARKFYSLFELECIARIAVPGASISAAASFPGISVLTARF